MNLLAELRRQSRQIENIDRETCLEEYDFSQLDQPPCLRHLARTSVLIARGAVNKQDARLLVQ